MLTDDDIITLTQAIERVLIEYDIHLTTDRFNALCDYVADLARDIKENGQ